MTAEYNKLSIDFNFDLRGQYFTMIHYLRI